MGQADRTGGFDLGYDSGCGCWVFALPTSDADGAGRVVAGAPASVIQAGAWTYLTGVYDATNGSATLYLGEVPVGAATVASTQWNATGSFTVGRGETNGAENPTGSPGRRRRPSLPGRALAGTIAEQYNS